MVWADPMVVGSRVRHWASHRPGVVTALWMWGGPPTDDPDDNIWRTKVSVQYLDGQFTHNRRRGTYYLRNVTDVEDDPYADRSHPTMHFFMTIPPGAPADAAPTVVSAPKAASPWWCLVDDDDDW